MEGALEGVQLVMGLGSVRGGETADLVEGSFG